MEPQIRYTTTDDGASIAYATMGAGPPVVMTPVIHQFLGLMRVSPARRALCEAIARDFTLIMYDGRGMGLSSRERREFDMEARFRDIEAVVRALRAEAFALYGPHFGGLIAMAYAARHPERVTCLVVGDSFARGEQYYREHPLGRVIDALGVVTEDQWHNVTEMIGARTVPDDADAQAGRALGALIRETWDPEAFMANRQANREVDTSAELGAIAVPTLIVSNGAGGAPFEFSRELAGAIPSARLIRITARSAGWDERDYAVLTAFLAEHAKPAGPPVGASASPATTPGGFRTVLFTDLVGHTEMMQRLGDDRGRDVLREHERITRETLKAHGGAEVKTMGDGFMASFGSVTAAMECAIALQRAFATHTESMPEPLHVRVGLNAGEPIEEDGDLFGSTVIMASRIAAQAGAGEILIPEPLRHLLSGKTYVYADRGEAMLKGFEDAVRLYEVRWRE